MTTTTEAAQYHRGMTVAAPAKNAVRARIRQQRYELAQLVDVLNVCRRHLSNAERRPRHLHHLENLDALAARVINALRPAKAAATMMDRVAAVIAGETMERADRGRPSATFRKAFGHRRRIG